MCGVADPSPDARKLLNLVDWILRSGMERNNRLELVGDGTDAVSYTGSGSAVSCVKVDVTDDRFGTVTFETEVTVDRSGGYYHFRFENGQVKRFSEDSHLLKGRLSDGEYRRWDNVKDTKLGSAFKALETSLHRAGGSRA